MGLAFAVRGLREKVWEPELEPLRGAGSPLFEVGHLDAGGGINAIGRLHKRGQGDRLQLLGQGALRDGFSDGIDPLPVFGLEESALLAEGLCEVASLPRQAVELGEKLQGLFSEGVVRLDIAASQGCGVGVVVVGQDLVAVLFQGMADSRRS